MTPPHCPKSKRGLRAPPWSEPPSSRAPLAPPCSLRVALARFESRGLSNFTHWKVGVIQAPSLVVCVGITCDHVCEGLSTM